MKKTLLALGTILSVSAPIAGVVSCSLVNHEKIEKYLELPDSTRRTDNIHGDVTHMWNNSAKLNRAINDDSEQGINFAVNDSLAAINSSRSDVIGILPYRRHSDGIFASNAWNKKEVDIFAKLFEAISWYNDSNVSGLLPGINGAMLNAFNVDLAQINTIALNDNASFLQSLNFKHAIRYDANDKIKTFANNKLSEVNAWSNGSGNEQILDETHFSSRKPFDQTNFMNEIVESVKSIAYTTATQSANEKTNFTAVSGKTLASEPIKIYHYWNEFMNNDKVAFKDTTDDFVLNEAIDGVNSSRQHFYDQMKDFFAAAGLNVEVVETHDLDLLTTKLGDKNERSLAFMPVDVWAQANKGGSLLVENRKETTIGETNFDEHAWQFTKPSIEVNESNQLHFVIDYAKSFADNYSKGAYTLKSVFETLEASKHVARGILNTAKLNLEGSTYFEEPDKLITQQLKQEVDNSNYPKMVDGKLEFLNPYLYTQYRSKYVATDFSNKNNLTSKIVSDIIAEQGPKLANEYEWEINAREGMPLPLKIGGLEWNAEYLNQQIILWVKKHIKI